jgi:SPFH domain/Band 7 family protein
VGSRRSVSPGEGVSNIGIFNKQRCFPATERNYIISSRANEADSKTVDFVEVPTSDAVAVRIEGQELFRLTTDAAALRDFYRRFGVRTFDGQHPYDGDSGWVSFLAIQFRPVLDNALREAIGRYRCEQLNNTCQYVQNANQAVSGRSRRSTPARRSPRPGTRSPRRSTQDLVDTLGGKYFEGIKLRLRGVSFAPEGQAQITRAQATARRWRPHASTPRSASSRRSAIASSPSSARWRSAPRATPTPTTRPGRASTRSRPCRPGCSPSAAIRACCSAGNHR